jgi:sulfite reductase beta subunit-like hemoprotein
MLRTLLADYKQNRADGEGFGDFCHRLGADACRAMVTPAPAERNGAVHAHLAPTGAM